jgi:hypothetical protein
MTIISSAFESPEYYAFKEHVEKCSSENSVKIKDNCISYGKTIKSIPAFINVEELEKHFVEQKTLLLLQYNDLYDKIIIAEYPNIFQKRYEAIVQQITAIDSILDEIHSYIEDKNEMEIHMPIKQVIEDLEMNKARAASLFKNMNEDVHLGREKIKELLIIHKENVRLEHILQDAKNALPYDYVIYKTKNQSLVPIPNKSISTSTPKKVSSRKQLTIDKRNTIKETVKKLMIEKSV